MSEHKHHPNCTGLAVWDGAETIELSIKNEAMIKAVQSYSASHSSSKKSFAFKIEFDKTKGGSLDYGATSSKSNANRSEQYTFSAEIEGNRKVILHPKRCPCLAMSTPSPAEIKACDEACRASDTSNAILQAFIQALNAGADKVVLAIEQSENAAKEASNNK